MTKRQPTKTESLNLGLMMVAGGLGFFLPRGDAWLSLLVIALCSAGCFVTFIVKNGLHREILRGLMLALVVMAVGFIPVIGWIVIIGFALYNIVRAVDGLKSLVPDVLTSLVIYGLLYSRLIFDIRDPIAIGALVVAYVVVAAWYCRTLAELPADLALFKLSIMWLSIPFVFLTIVSLVSALGNLFRTLSSTVSRTVLSPQLVSGHMRGGIEIGAYTRNVTTTVTQTVTAVAPSAGVVVAGATGGFAETVKKRGDKKD